MIATSRYSRITILRTKTELSTNGLRISPNSSTRSSRIATPPPRAMSRTGAAAKASARVGAPAYSWPSPGKISERKAAANGDRARGRAPSGSCIARRILGPAETSTRRTSTRRARPSRCSAHPSPRGRMFRPVSSKPDLVAQEYEILDLWRERRTFARLRAQNAGGPKWSFLDGPITANNPMGVHHAWGRAYKDVFCRYHAMLGEDERWQNGFDC